MASGKVSATLITIAVFFNAALALPLTTCPVFECAGANDILDLVPGKTYTYTFDSLSSSVLSGATVPQGKLQLTSEVTLQAVSACSAIVTVKKPLITNGDKKHQGGATIEGTPVMIGIKDGHLVTEFCANRADTITSLNFKRAIASLFQVITSNGEYTDIFGTCYAESSVTPSGDVTEVLTTRNLNACKKRESFISSIPSSTYDFSANVQAAPVLKSSARLEQRLKGKVLEWASGHEEYHFQPYNNQGNGAVITVSTNISLTSTTDGATPFAAPEPTSVSVIFESPHSSNYDYSNSKTIQAAIDSACEGIKSSSVESAHYVQSLIQVVRQSSVVDLLKAVNSNKNKCGAKLMMDALLNAATGQSVEALVKLAKNKAFTDLEQLYASLAFNRHPTLSAIKAVTTLIEKGSPPRNLVLGAGAFVGKYNEQHGTEANKEIDTLLERIARPLENCQAKTHEQEDKILTALKGLHNAHYIPDSVADKLKECVSRKYSTRVRSAVLDAIQSDAANKKLKPTVLEILSDREEDSELRIKAYLVAATCPCGQVFETVNTLIASEPVNQVGSFIATHLRNLRVSSNPDKAGAKNILGAIRVPAGKYKYDYRRFSTNSELSFSLGKEGVAASAESNVIFSQNSFLPRSTDLNLTANVLGHSFNLLEVGLRAENLEHVLEAYLGPKGYFKTRNANQVITSGNETVNVLAQKIKERATQSIRNKRSVDRSSVDKISSKVQLEETDDKINVDLYIKLFGYELAFYSYYGNPGEFSPAGLIDKIFDNVDNTIKTAKDYNVNFDKNLQLFNVELAYPTYSGFPVKLSSVGTAAVKLEVKTSFDLPAIVDKPKDTNFQIKFIPSATIELASEFAVDFVVATSGLKHAATIHTSNGVDLTFKMLEGKGFDLNIGTPLAKQELIHIKSELFSTSRDKGAEVKQTPLTFTIPRRQYQGCFDQLSQFLGVTFCGDVNFPAEGLPKKGPFFPLDGPAEMFVVIKKDDASLAAYNINSKYHDETPNVRGWSLQFSTPGASSERLIRFFFTFAKSDPNLEYKLEFTSPIKSGYAAVTVVQEEKKQLALDSILKLDADEYKAKIGLQVIESSDTSTTYKPELVYSGPGTEGKSMQYKVDGLIKKDKNGQELKLTFTDVAVTVPKNKYQLNGFALRKSKGYEVDLNGKYNDPAETITLKSNYEAESDKNCHLDLEFKMSKYPDTAFSAVYDGNRDENLLENKIKVFHGPDLKDEKNCVTINQYYKAEKTDKKFDAVIFKNKFSYPVFGIFFNLDVEGHNGKSLHYLLESGFEKQRLSSELNFKFNLPGPDGIKDDKGLSGYDLNFKAGAGENTILVNTARQIVTKDTSKVQFSTELQPKGYLFKVDSDITHRFQKNDLKAEITSVFTVTNFPDTLTICTGVESTAERAEAHFKFLRAAEELLRVRGETKKGDIETGKFEAFLKDYVDCTGTFSHTKGKNEGTLEATMVSAKLDRKVTVNGKLAPGAKPTIRKLNVVVLLDADKDANNKVTLDSDIDLLKDGRSYDTKTTLDIVGKVFILSLKGVVPNRTPLDNGIMGKFDTSIELPSKQVISTYWDLIQLQEAEGRGMTSTVKFNDGKDNKLSYKGKYYRAQGYSVPTYNMETKIDLKAEDKNLAIQYSVINAIAAEKKTVSHSIDVTGNVVPQPFHSTFTAEVVDTPTYTLKANYGERIAIDSETFFNFKDKSDHAYNLKFNLKSDFKGYEQVKYTTSYKGSLSETHGKGDARDFLEVNNARVYDVSVGYDYTHSETECKGSTKVTTFLGAEETQPRVLSVSHTYNGPTNLKADSTSARKFVGSVGLEQGNTAFVLKVDGETPGDGTNSGKLGFELDSPVDNYEKIVMKIDHKSQKNGKLLETQVDTQLGKTDDRHFISLSKVDLSELNRVFSVQVTKFDKTPILKSFASYQRPTNSELQGEINLSIGGTKPRNLAVNGVAKYPGGFDDFDVVLNVDSEDLKLNKVRVHVENKNTGKGHKIIFSAKSADKTYLDGSTSYQKKEEARGVTYEGKGDVELDGQKYNSEFKLAHKLLQKSKDAEAGFDVTLSGSLTGASKKTLESQLTVTDKALKVYNKFCGDKCSLIDVLNTVKITDATELSVENKINFDIQHSTNEFYLNIGSNYHRKNLNFDHKIEAELGKGDKATKYVYNAFNQERTAGLHLITPKRTFAIDSVFSAPEKGKNEASQSYKGEVTVNLDKANQPDQKLTLLSSLDISKGKDGTTYSSDLKVSHPLIGKDLVVKAKTLVGTGQVLLDTSLTLDVFAKKNQAIVVSLKNERVPITDGHNMTSTLKVSSKAQNLDVTSVNHLVATKNEVGFGSVITCKHDKDEQVTAVLFSANSANLLVFARSPSCEILRVHGDCNRQQGELQKSNLFLSFLETLAIEGEITGYHSLKYQAYDSNKPDVRTIYTGNFELEKEILFEAQHSNAGKLDELFKLRVALDSAHFLQTEQKLDADQLKVALTGLQTLAKSTTDRLTKCVVDNFKAAETRAKVMFEGLKKAQPNLQPLINRCKEQFEDLQNEFKADPTINNIIELVQSFVGGLAKTVTKFLQTLGEHFEKFSTALKEWAVKISELITKLTPLFTEAIGNISRSFASVITSFLEIFTKVSGKILEALKANSADIQKIFSLFSDFIKDQSVQLKEVANQLRSLFEELIKSVIKQLESQPLLDNVKVKYTEFYKMFLERFEGVFQEISESLREVLPNQELKELADAFSSYITKKLKGEPMDEIKELKLLSEKLIKTITALVNLPEGTGVPLVQGLNLENVLKFSFSPASFESLTALPQFASLKVSILELLGSSDLPSAADLFFTYAVPRRFDDAVPPHRAFGLISGSKHFYTFDGSHYTLNGDCQYLLAKDFDDGNFSLVAELAGNELRSVAYIDSQDVVEIKADHSVLLNGQVVDLPVHQHDISIFRTLHSVNVKSKYGVEVACDLHHDLCTFAVNGYYYGKTRGLLGTISNEKYDDWTLPNGKIATTVSQFSNSYMLGESCPNKTPVEHTHVSNTECINAFSRPAPFSECFKFVDPTPYRQGCEDAIVDAQTPEQKTEALCDAAVAYVAKCRDTTFLQPTLPKHCTKCTLGDKEFDVGQSAVVKGPNGKADIVVLVEQTSENEQVFKDLIPALSTQLKEDLGKQGITDVKAYLVGYGAPGQHYPSLYTVDSKFGFDGTAPKQLSFGAQTTEVAGGVTVHPLIAFLNRAKELSTLELGFTPLAQAFRQVIEFPFRAEAAKAVFLVRSSECHKSALPLSMQQLTFLQARTFFKDRGITVALFQPIEFSTSADKKVMGFDAENAILYTKKVVDPAGRADVTYTDNCSPYINTVQPVVFSTKVFLSLKDNPRKQFIQSASSRLATLLSTETTQNCDCTLHEGLHAQPKCSVSATKLNKGKKN